MAYLSPQSIYDMGDFSIDKIRQSLSDFKVPHQERTGILFNDKVLTISYLGVGKEIEDVKNEFFDYF